MTTSPGEAWNSSLPRRGREPAWGAFLLILLLAWVLKISTPRLQDQAASFRLAHSVWEVLANAAFGSIPGWLVVAGVAAFFLWLLYACLRSPGDAGEGDFGEVHV